MCDTPEFGEEQKQAMELCERLRGAGGIEIKDRRYLRFSDLYLLLFIIIIISSPADPSLTLVHIDSGVIRFASWVRAMQRWHVYD